MNSDSFLTSDDGPYRNAPFHLGAQVTSYSDCPVDSDAGVGSSIAPSSPHLSTCSGSVYSSASQVQSPAILHYDDPARSAPQIASFDGPQVQAQTAYLETTVEKLRTELARVRDSNSITDLSNSRLSLSSIERDLASKFDSPSSKYRHVSRHFAQLQGVYGKAFSDIFKVVSAEAGPRSNLNSIQSTLESSIDPIAEEYKSFIGSLESQLDTLAGTPTKRNTRTEAAPTSTVLTSSASRFDPFATQKEESDVKTTRLQTPSSEAAANDICMTERSPTFHQDGRSAVAEVHEGEGKRLPGLKTEMEQPEIVKTKAFVDANEAHLEPASATQVDGRLLGSFQELQIRHATTVDELEHVRTQYLTTLRELDEMTAQHEEARRRVQSSSRLHQSSLASLTTSYSTPSTTSAASPSSPISFSPRRFPVHNGSSLLTNRRSRWQDYAVRPKKDVAEKEVLLQPIQVGDQAEQPRAQEEIYRNALQLSLEDSSHRSIPTRNSRNVPSTGSLKRGYSNSGTPSLQPLNLPLIRSSFSSIPQYSVLRGLMRSPNSPAPVSSVAEFSSPVPVNFANDQYTPHNAERSHESLEREVLQLQQVLKEREEEIRELELTIRQAPSLSELVDSPKSDHSVDPSGSNGYAHVSIPKISQNSNDRGCQLTASSRSHIRANKDDHHLSPALPCEVIETSQKSFSDINRNQPANFDNTESLNVLMRSMAKKESNFLETIGRLKSQLNSTERKHQDLVKLSADQVANMSSEIEALHERLKMSQAPNREVNPELLREQDLHAEQDRQAEIQALKDLQQLELEKVKMERSENFNQLFNFTNDKLMAKEEELRQLEIYWQAKLKAELTAQADLIWAQSDTQQSNLVRTQIKSFGAKASREREAFDREIEQLNKKHAEEIETLREGMNAKLKSAESDSTNRIQELELMHAQEMAQVTSSLPSNIQKVEESFDGVSQAYVDEFQTWHTERNQLESRIHELENEKLYLISEHEMRLEQLKAEHATLITELQAENDDTLIGALSELDQRRTIKFQAQLKMAQENHVLKINEIKLIYEQKIEMINSEATQAYQSQSESKQTYPDLARSVVSPDVYSSTDPSNISVRVDSTTDTAILNPRMLKKIEDQESAISKLTKQLEQCEGNLRANISAIAQLEDALNDTERNLRKSRLQMNALVQERDKMSILNQRLTMGLNRSTEEVEHLKQSLQDEKLNLERRLSEERLAKETARAQLETRMLEVQKSQEKKNKFK
ncbi:hypothetical protein PGTUg99_001286 [Puccinia graminis f. sp. tritici]|uniref:Uncharacterized protein n=1 Tax=Puccinia graminis f. sp. tritici TaxID=56615 RepID=A0A5B0RW65_PUCGR|nr:hypothetical protein PGTUg99_002590 [Puccinia graminis f. sp. tritici]KAA1134573.1 hypothetical protein PGTUg99_001286 [Puccinia graminis f. sp. tritici]